MAFAAKHTAIQCPNCDERLQCIYEVEPNDRNAFSKISPILSLNVRIELSRDPWVYRLPPSNPSVQSAIQPKSESTTVPTAGFASFGSGRSSFPSFALQPKSESTIVPTTGFGSGKPPMRSTLSSDEPPERNSNFTSENGFGRRSPMQMSLGPRSSPSTAQGASFIQSGFQSKSESTTVPTSGSPSFTISKASSSKKLDVIVEDDAEIGQSPQEINEASNWEAFENLENAQDWSEVISITK